MQNTLENPVFLEGKGLHNGKKNKIIISPAPINTGIVFCVKGKQILTNYAQVLHKPLCTCLAYNQNIYIRTVEHLLATLYSAEIDNAYIYTNDSEIPLLDGSCIDLYKSIKAAGMNSFPNAPQKILKIKKTIAYRKDNRYIKTCPSKTFKINLQIKPKCGYQNYNNEISPKLLIDECIDARTFGPLYKGMLAKVLTKFSNTPCAQGANWRNSILLTKNRSIIKGGLRYNNEHVRHRVMDLVGDLMLCGSRHIQGYFETYSTSHEMNTELLKKIFSDESNYEWIIT
ncbi:UDP-3-O-acyl-N-acetylglucosamine deacetylase [Francisella uliginis]|uniref:UDP-3-O-acyl-N-acetylglucosamine deacetylase n=1 Tax=Francisella uliginis TaxID=573570 RepID=A0A1L4BU55_9GAMM|nr:UDP-3-O-acyl-N-acetylglucosamine deacetylase [Francisella uliginis]API87380.1 UDP-3-O-[3-hydroxymyristoyl] N-acetylglucosamine deacetylase [Francisella uliginis]